MAYLCTRQAIQRWQTHYINVNTQIMKKWKCKVCGYIHQGDEPPEFCPKCGAARSQFKEEKEKGEGCAFGVLLVIALIAAFCLNFASCSSELTVNNAVMQQPLDLNRYLGKWYEVARFDHKFERGLTHCTAEYSLKKGGQIKVLNRGKKNGKWNTAEGKARTTDTPGLLRVSFFGPFYSDYRILMLSPDYSYALVGSGSDDYLWILSRTPELTPADRGEILMEAQTRGYDTSRLIWVEQN